MIRAIALDDEPHALKVIENFCSHTPEIQLARTFVSTKEAMKYLEETPVDLLFLDMEMPGMSGMEFMKSLPRESMVIFTTAYSEYAVAGFNLNAVDFLLKPFTEERFRQAVEKVVGRFQSSEKKPSGEEGDFFIRANYGLLKIEVDDILYVEGMDDYIRIHFGKQKPVLVRMTMKSLLAQLPPRDFVRIHRSYILPVIRIKEIRNKKAYTENGEFPIGPTYLEKLKF